MGHACQDFYAFTFNLKTKAFQPAMNRKDDQKQNGPLSFGDNEILVIKLIVE